jgi:RNA polymerase sigma factor (sigma-70 family)
MEVIAELAAAVASRYLNGLSFHQVEVAQDLGFDAEDLQRRIQGSFGSYELFLRSIIPGMSSIGQCEMCVQPFQANPGTEDTHCASCLLEVATRGIKYLAAHGHSVRPEALLKKPNWKWIVERSEELWDCTYRDLVLRELGLVLPIPKNKVKRKRPAPKIRSERLEPTKVPEKADIPFPKLGELTIEKRNRLVEQNIPLVWFYARKFVLKFQLRKMELEDVVQAGLEGLMRAVEKFDVEKGYKFSTYAIWWIRQKIQRAYLEENFACKLPARYNVHDDEYNVTVVTSLDSAASLMEAYLATASYEEGFDKVEALELLNSLEVPPLALDIFREAVLDGRTLPELAETYNLPVDEVRELYRDVADKLEETFIQERGLLES